MKKRFWTFRIASVLLIALGLWILIRDCLAPGDINAPLDFLATVLLCVGAGVWIMASPQSYNSSVTDVKMVVLKTPRTIEEFYEAYKEVPSSLGACYLASITGIEGKCLVWGPDIFDDYIYFYLKENGEMGYLGVNQTTSMIGEHYTEPVEGLSLVPDGLEENTWDYEYYPKRTQLFYESIQRFADTGEVTELEHGKKHTP